MFRKIVAAFVFCVCAVSVTFADSNYTVKRGDTLYSISRTYQITVAELCAANNFSEKDVLKAGQTLVIPSADISNAAALSTAPINGANNSSASADSSAASTASTINYVVQKGDTLYGIARKFGMSLSELVSINNMADNVLKVGQTLRITKSEAKAQSANVAAASATSNKNESAKNSAVSNASASSLNNAQINNAQIVWPLSNSTVQNVKGKVSGVKLMSENDNKVTAVRSGTVMYTGAYRGFGQVVFVESKTGLIYAYTWLSSISVKKGDYVVYGDTLGNATTESGSGKQTVTFMVFQNGTPVDPSRAPRG